MVSSGPWPRKRAALCLVVLFVTASCAQPAEQSARHLDQPPAQTEAPTPLRAGAARKFPTLVAAGDISLPRFAAQGATAALVGRLAPTRVLTLGDEQYDEGALTAYEHFYDPTWGRFKAKTLPAPGNHEYDTSGAPGYFRYFGSAATSNRHSYYSVNLGSFHIVSLNSNIARSGSSPQLTWLRHDLAANKKRCVLAFWHHPRFSSGTEHGSDPSVAAFWGALFHARADIVLNGHEHNYERFGRQTPAGTRSKEGIREFVVGTGGASHYGFGPPKPHSRVRISKRFGVLRLALRPAAYKWKFVSTNGAVLDKGGPVRCH